MSKYVKDLITTDLRNRLNGADSAMLVNVVGMPNERTVMLRRELRQKKIHLTVVKNSLARRATEGTPLAAAFEDVGGTLAILWGGEDAVSLAKEVMRLAGTKGFEPFGPRGGVMDGQKLSPEEVQKVSKWPSRQEQLSILSGQILSVGANLSAALLGPGKMLNSQIKKKGEEGEGEEGEKGEGGGAPAA